MSLRPHSYRRYYAALFCAGICVAAWSALMDPNPIAFIAGLLVGGGATAFDREVKYGK